MEEIKQAVKYLLEVSIEEPIEIKTEEVEFGKITLSYREKADFMWGDRIYKEFIFENGEVVSMKSLTLK